jgi:hypothetical protein
MIGQGGRRMSLRFVLGVVLLIAIQQLLVQTSMAQQSRIIGTVTDQSGAVVPDVSVTAKNIATGETRQATSSSVGEYAIPNLAAGSYLVIADKQGFKRQVLEHVRLEVQAAQSVDFILRPGAESEQVTVTSTPPALQTTDSSVSTFFETKVVDEIPLNGRNFLQLQLLSPGVTMGGPGVWQAIQISALNTSIGGGNFSVGGAPDTYNDFLLDGLSFKETMDGINGLNPSVDAVQEFRLQSSNYSAEYGGSAGGLVNMITKSGTNNWHGTAYDFLRNDKFDAANYFTNQAGEPKTPLRRNQFGGTLGGPIKHDKTFFFFSYEGFRQQSTTTQFDNFPSAKMRTGDFSELLNLPTPIVIDDPSTGQPYPGNVIPANQVLSVMPDYLQKYIPLPNRPGFAQNYVVPGTDHNTTDQYIGKIDQTLTDKLRLSGRYVYNKINDIPPTTIPAFAGSQNSPDQNLELHLVDTISPTTILDLRAGWNSFKQFSINRLQNTKPDIASDILGIHGVATDPRASGAPFFLTVGFGTLSGGGGPRQWFSERYEYRGTLSLVRGKHLISAGLQAIRHHETFQEIILPNGLYVFDGTFTGYPMADMLLGIPTGYQLSPDLFNPLFREWEVMPWVEDDWRATSKLTLNLGLRYEWRPWPISQNNSISNLILPPGGGLASLVLAGPCIPNAVTKCESTLPTSISKTRSTFNGNPDKSFAPRIGFAYRLGNSGRTVIRGAYGIFFQPEPFNGLVNLSYNPPFVAYYDRFNNLSNFQSWDWFHPTAGLPPGGIQFTQYPADSAVPYLQAWNFGLQHDLGSGFVLDASYVGNHDTHMWSYLYPNQPHPGPGDVDSRRPYPNVSTIISDQSNGDANYNGLQVRVEKRFSQGLSLLAGYTWSKALTDTQGSSSFSPDIQNEYNRAANYGLWSADVRHRATITALYELPFGHGKTYLSGLNGLPGKMISGWQLSAIAQFQTGEPLTVTLPFDNPNVGEGAKYPNVIGDPNSASKTVSEFFNTAAFAVPPQYTFGDEGIGAVTGPGINDIDLSLIKNTNLSERTRLQFRVEAFNAANHLIMGPPNSIFGTPTFGQVTSTRLDNREVQLALRLEF